MKCEAGDKIILWRNQANLNEGGGISFKILPPIGKSYSSETYKIDLHARKVRPKEGRKIAQVQVSE